jgi:tRNA G18 (ribose-2'-O)-methylase SpoU
LAAIHIDALDDPRVADYRHTADAEYLKARSLFVAEGRMVVTRLLALSQWKTHSILVTKAAADSLGATLDRTGAPVYLADQSLMNAIAGFHIHRGCLALAARHPEHTLDRAVADRAQRALILEGVSNPDNVGGLFRSAEAFGVDLVVLGPGCGDPLYRKAIRTSMASTLAVPFVQAGEWPGAIGMLRASRFQVIALTPSDRALLLADMTPAGPKVAVLVGAEGAGLSDPAMQASDMRARIPMSGALDSLNVTTAASIALYHVYVTNPPHQPDPPHPPELD